MYEETKDILRIIYAKIEEHLEILGPHLTLYRKFVRKKS